MPLVLECLPPDWKRAPSPIVDHLFSLVSGDKIPNSRIQRFSLGYYDAVRFARSTSFAVVLQAFESQLQLLVAENARRRIFVHAGVVGWKNQAIVIPGRSFSGKSTLVDKLVRAGATYYSDEYAVFDERGRVYPFLRPLKLRAPQSLAGERLVPVPLNGHEVSKPLTVRLIISTKYKPSASWRPRRLSPGRGVLELLSNTVSARSHTRRAIDTLTESVRSAEVLKGVRGEAEEIVEDILSRVA